MRKLLEKKKVARILEVAKKVPSNSVESPRDGGRGDYSIKLCLESLSPEVQSLTLMYTIFDKRYVPLSSIFH